MIDKVDDFNVVPGKAERISVYYLSPVAWPEGRRKLRSKAELIHYLAHLEFDNFSLSAAKELLELGPQLQVVRQAKKPLGGES
jgi:hypothetical protein